MTRTYCECCKTNIIFQATGRWKPNKNLRYCKNCGYHLKLYGSKVHSQYYRKVHRFKKGLLKFISNQKKMGLSSKLILKNLKKEITREVASSARSPPK